MDSIRATVSSVEIPMPSYSFALPRGIQGTVNVLKCNVLGSHPPPNSLFLTADYLGWFLFLKVASSFSESRFPSTPTWFALTQDA